MATQHIVNVSLDQVLGGDSVRAASMTSRGGRQYDLDALVEPPSCSSVYGLCE